MQPYCLRWNRLQRGRSAEFRVHSALTAAGYELSLAHGIRLNLYPPSLDIDNVDVVIRCETAAWTLYIEAAVRSSERPGLTLGTLDEYGSLVSWIDRARRRAVPVPCVIFFYDWKTDQIYFALPSAIAPDVNASPKRIDASQTFQPASKDQLVTFFERLAQVPTESEARAWMA